MSYPYLLPFGTVFDSFMCTRVIIYDNIIMAIKWLKRGADEGEKTEEGN